MAQLQKCFKETCEWLSIDRKSLKDCGSNSFWKGTEFVYKKKLRSADSLEHIIWESGQKSHYRKYCYQSHGRWSSDKTFIKMCVWNWQSGNCVTFHSPEIGCFC